MKDHLRTEIAREGQRFVDRPVYEDVSRPRPAAAAVAQALRAAPPRRIVHVAGYERTELRWMKPDGKGGFVPKDDR